MIIKRKGVIYAAFILAVLIAAASTNLAESTFELTYCVEKKRLEGQEFSCTKEKRLRIRRDYLGDLPSLNFSKPDASDWITLAVAYPSMEPWADIPFSKRKNMEKIELSLRRVSNRHLKGQDAVHYFLGTPKPVLKKTECSDSWSMKKKVVAY